MSGLGFNLDWSPRISLLASGFDTMGTSIKSYKEPLERSIRQVMVPSIKENFAAQGRPSWKPLHEITVNKKGHDTILSETGRLESKASLIKNWSVDGLAGEAKLDKIEVPYAYYHQTGFTNHRSGKFTVAREWAAFQPEDEEAIEAIFWEWLEERWNLDVAMGRI